MHGRPQSWRGPAPRWCPLSGVRPGSSRWLWQAFPVPDRGDILALDVYIGSFRQNRRREGPAAVCIFSHADAVGPTLDLHARVVKLQTPPRLAADRRQELECLFLRWE